MKACFKNWLAWYGAGQVKIYHAQRPKMQRIMLLTRKRCKKANVFQEFVASG
jgi:hypothetical protein